MHIFEKRPGEWWIDYYFMGRRKREKVGIKSLAQRRLEKVNTEIAEGKFLDIRKDNKILFDEIAQDFLDYSKTNKRSYKRDIKLIDHLKTRLGGKRLAEITPIALETYKGERLGTGLMPASVNRELACGKAIFNWAIKGDKTLVNPFRKVKMFREDNEILRYLTREEIAKFLPECLPPLRRVVVCALNSGLRKGDILNMTWDKVKLEQNLLLIKSEKTGKLNEIPINASLRKILIECLAIKNGPNVFQNEDGQPYRKLDTAFESARRRSKLEHFRFHDLRATFASHMVMNGVDLVTVSKLLGHSNIRTTMRYARLSPAHKRSAVEILGTCVNPEIGEKSGKVGNKWTPNDRDQSGHKKDTSEQVDLNSSSDFGAVPEWSKGAVCKSEEPSVAPTDNNPTPLTEKPSK